MTQQQEAAALSPGIKALVAKLRRGLADDAVCREAASLITTLTARVAELGQSYQLALNERDQWREKCREAQGNTLTAERALATARADAFEEAAKIVEAKIFDLANCPASMNYATSDAIAICNEVLQDRAAAIRAASLRAIASSGGKS